MTPARRREVYAAYGETCIVPGCTEFGAEIDHVQPLNMRGADELHNLRPMCGAHHRAKSKIDASNYAKAVRRERKHAGPRQPKRDWPSRKIESRGFDKSRTRHVNGRVTAREKRA